MIKTFKERAPTVQAVEFTDALMQSPLVANLIGATSMIVDMTNKRTEFTVGEITQATYTAVEGDVVSLIAGAVVVMAAADFYAKYEAI